MAHAGAALPGIGGIDQTRHGVVAPRGAIPPERRRLQPGSMVRRPRTCGIRPRAAPTALPAVAPPHIPTRTPGRTASGRRSSASLSEGPSGQAASEWHGPPLRGDPEPLGATPIKKDAVNFSISAPNATSVSLCLFERGRISSSSPTAEVALSPRENRTGGVWHVRLPGITPGLLYGFRVDGPSGPGFAFDPSVVLLDPYARGVWNGRREFGALRATGPEGEVRLSDAWAPAAGEVPDPAAVPYDWEGDAPLRLPMEETVVYETHVRGFTASETSGLRPDLRGTYAGFAHRLEYLAGLGVTAIELLPMQEFNELEYASDTNRGRVNFWGYSTLGFFAPMARYARDGGLGDDISDDGGTDETEGSAAQGGPAMRGGGASSNAGGRPSPPQARVRPLAALDEFRDLVKAAHRVGLEVILDVVFNHTAEGSERGPTLSFRGLDARSYYMLAPRGECYNYSGCGNTFNANHPVAARFVLDCLRFWVAECHVDGFRFDLASILTRAPSIWPPPRPSPVAGSVFDAAGGEEVALSRCGAGGEGSSAAAGGVGGEGLAAAAATGGVDREDLSSPGGADAQGSSPRGGAGAAGGDLAGGRPAGGDVRVEPVPAALGSAVVGVGRRVSDASAPSAAEAPGILGDGTGVPTGTPLSDPPLVRVISEDPLLAGTKLIAEAWDCDGLVQLGAFPHHGGRWSEWNGRFRDTVRGFIKGSEGPWVSAFAAALCGSADVFFDPAREEDWWGSGAGAVWRGGRGPPASINFVTAHDGFSLADLVSYNEKHNEANGEDNRDGESHNLSWNCGAEGATDDPAVLSLRARQSRNLLAALLLSAGVPMLLMGDEVGHSKGGNNNTYCVDGNQNRLDWDAARADGSGIRRFVRALLAVRRANPQLRRGIYPGPDAVTWHGMRPGEPDWSESSRLLAFSAPDGEGGGIYAAFNAGHEPVLVEQPRWEGREWQKIIDSSRPAPFDALFPSDAAPEEAVRAVLEADGGERREHALLLLPYSAVVCVSVADGRGGEPLPWTRLPSEAGSAWMRETGRT